MRDVNRWIPGHVRWVRLLMLSLLLACAEAEPGRDAPLERAGVQTVRNIPPYPTLSLDARPVLRIGSVDGTPDEQFSDVVFAAGLSDGRLVIVDRDFNDVRWYAPDGSPLSRAGGRGEGPGEFLGVVAGVLLAADTVVLFDARNQRLTWFGPDGGLERTRPFRATSAFSVTLGDLGSGRVVVIENRATLNFGGSEFNYARDSLLLMLPHHADEGVDTILTLAGREAATWIDYRNGQTVGTRQMELPLGDIGLAQGVRNGIIVVHPGSSELAFYSIAGTLLRVARRDDLTTVEASPTVRRRYIESTLERAGADGQPTDLLREGLEKRLALLREGHTVPAFDRILIEGGQGRIWLREWVPPWAADEPSRWTVYGRDGGIDAQVEMPARFRPTHVFNDKVVGVETDELDVEYVARYVISRAPDGSQDP